MNKHFSLVFATITLLAASGCATARDSFSAQASKANPKVTFYTVSLKAATERVEANRDQTQAELEQTKIFSDRISYITVQ